MKIAELLASNDGTLPAYAWPGGYPLHYYSKRGDTFCADCANQSDAEPEIVDADIALEGPSDYCEGCGKELETAYGDPDKDSGPLHYSPSL